MQAVMDFLMSALPWVAIGLFATVSAVKAFEKRAGHEISRTLRLISWCPVALFLLLAIIQMYGIERSGSTWLVIGLCNAVINWGDSQKKAEK